MRRFRPALLLSFAAFMAPAVCGAAEDPVVLEVLGRQIHSSEIEPSPGRIDELRAKMTPEMFGESLRLLRQGQFLDRLLYPLLDAYAKRESILPKEADVERLLDLWAKQHPGERDAPERVEKARRDSLHWHVQAALHAIHGGRSIYSAPGTHPFAALWAFLLEEEAVGRLKYLDEETKNAVEATFTQSPLNIAGHDAILLDRAQTADYFKEPWWRQAPGKLKGYVSTPAGAASMPSGDEKALLAGQNGPRVLSPNGGETYILGEPIPIKVFCELRSVLKPADPDARVVGLSLAEEKGGEYAVLGSLDMKIRPPGPEARIYSFPWYIEMSVPPGKYRLRARVLSGQRDDLGSDESNSWFEIQASHPAPT